LFGNSARKSIEQFRDSMARTGALYRALAFLPPELQLPLKLAASIMQFEQKATLCQGSQAHQLPLQDPKRTLHAAK
jgi:hypothetical protein